MGMGGDFNQMQMMMAMQNSMGPNGFGSFPMMGMCAQPIVYNGKYANIFKECPGWAWIRWRCKI